MLIQYSDLFKKDAKFAEKYNKERQIVKYDPLRAEIQQRYKYPRFVKHEMAAHQVTREKFFQGDNETTVFYVPSATTGEKDMDGEEKIKCTEIGNGLHGSRWAVIRHAPRNYASY